ncbi:MAG: hypothetical protein AAFV80_20100, partial [Bacteroidota bacterium]
MKTYKILFLLPCLLLILANARQQKSPVAELDLAQRYSQFQTALMSLLDEANQYRTSPESAHSLRQALVETRLAYKEFSFLLTYFYPAFAEDHLNGAPLLKAKKHSTHSVVEPPEGLQVLDEMIFAEPIEEPGQVAIQIRLLANKALELANDFSNKRISLDQLVEASKLGLNELFTLGLTGFDTPGSLNAIPEGIASLSGMWSMLSTQENVQRSRHFSLLNESFDQALRYLEQAPDFNTFDRLTFYRDHLQALYSHLVDIQEELGLSTKLYFPSGRKATARSLFDADFLDPFFFTELDAQKDSPALRSLGKALF